MREAPKAQVGHPGIFRRVPHFDTYPSDTESLAFVAVSYIFAERLCKQKEPIAFPFKHTSWASKILELYELYPSLQVDLSIYLLTSTTSQPLQLHLSLHIYIHMCIYVYI